MIVHQIEALKEAGCDEVVLAINYRPQVSGWHTPCAVLSRQAHAGALGMSLTLSKVHGTWHVLQVCFPLTLPGDDGLLEGVGGEAGHQDHMLPGALGRQLGR
jgi:hypothetical protein